MIKTSHLLPGAVLALAITPAAQGNVEVYGQAHMAALVADDGDDYSALNFTSNNSRIGFRAEHDIDMNLTAFAQVETQVDFGTTNNNSLSARDSFLGLKGHWGQLRAGRFDSPSKRLRNATDLFGNQLGDMRNLARGNYRTIPGDGDSQLQGFDERIRHSVAYRTPTLNGFSAEVLYSAEHQDNGDAADSNPNDAFSGALTFRMGGVYAALSHERWNNEDPDDERNVTRAAGSWDTGLVRLTGFVQRATDPADWVYSVGGRYALTHNMGLRAQYTMLDADDSDFDGQQIALGGDYQYSPELRFYANYAQLSNDAQLTQAPWREASTLGERGAADETARAFSVGAVYSF